MKEMTMHDIVKKLIGKVGPVGESTEDGRRYKNLDATIDLLDCLIGDVEYVASFKDREEDSIRKAASQRLFNDMMEQSLSRSLNKDKDTINHKVKP
jgi:hypothetical protein